MINHGENQGSIYPLLVTAPQQGMWRTLDYPNSDMCPDTTQQRWGDPYLYFLLAEIPQDSDFDLTQHTGLCS